MMKQATPIMMIYVTINNMENANRLAKHLLDHKLIACVNIIGEKSPVVSHYFWNNKIQQDEEILMMMKSRQELFEKITEEVKKNHPYECPEVIGFPVLSHQAYSDWVIANTISPSEQ